MRRLDAEDILELGDSIETSGLASLALDVLDRALPETDHGGLTIGQRDALLLAVRARMSGPRIELLAPCPQCAAQAEIALTAEDVGLSAPPLPQPPEPRAVRIGGHEVTLTPVTAGALAVAEQEADPARIRERLLSLTVLAVDGDTGAEVPDGIVPEIEAALADLDPLAEILLETSCPDCGHQWDETFDAATLVRGDIRNHATRLLSEVAALARAYHWSEHDILAMPASRRRFYLEAAGA